MTNTPGDYERPGNYEPGCPDIFFVHKEVVKAFGPLEVVYEKQEILHRYEISGWLRQDNVPGWPWSPENVEDEKDIVRVTAPDPLDPRPTTYIDLGPPPSNDPVLKPKSSKKLSDDSSRNGNDIYINLRTFPHVGRNTATRASTTRLSRELILQSAIRAVVNNNRLIRRKDIVHEMWLPIEGSIATGGLTWLLATDLAALGVASTTLGITSAINLAELRDTRRERIKAIVIPMAEGLIKRHESDFSFPSVGKKSGS